MNVRKQTLRQQRQQKQVEENLFDLAYLKEPALYNILESSSAGHTESLPKNF